MVVVVVVVAVAVAAVAAAVYSMILNRLSNMAC